MSLLDLSNEILMDILLYLPHKDIMSVAQCNKQLHSICRSSYLWSQKAFKDLKVSNQEFYKERNPVRRYMKYYYRSRRSKKFSLDLVDLDSNYDPDMLRPDNNYDTFLSGEYITPD